MHKPDKVYRSDDFYIGDAQRQIMQKYSFVTHEGYKFSMETSVNDSLMVVCNDDFYVCPHCGYAESTRENMEDASFNSHQKTIERKHVTPWGKRCEVKLVKNKLCHVFRTDVVRLVFENQQAADQEIMLSVMYALIEALSSVLDIERNDIKGCTCNPSCYSCLRNYYNQKIHDKLNRHYAYRFLENYSEPFEPASDSEETE